MSDGRPPDEIFEDPFGDDERARERAERYRRRQERRKARRQLGEAAGGEPAGDDSGAGAPPPDPQPQSSDPPPERPPRRERPPRDERPRPRISLPAFRLPDLRLPDSLRNLRIPPGRVAGGFVLLAVVGFVVLVVLVAGDRLGSSDPESAVTEVPPVTTVTIPEGYTRAQIAQTAKEAGLRGSYRKASNSVKGFDPQRYGAPADPDSLEGFLFPATYELRPRAPARRLVALQLSEFTDRIRTVDMKKAQKKNLNVYDVLKIASMIEREVIVPKERRLVAAVIYNRLAAGEPLGIDATIRYELGNFDEPLTESELAADTPYNTRINPGLPPTPIGNPGMATIEAAANPADVDHRYYVVIPDTCGEHFFTDDFAEFEEAAARYQQALEEQGGAPTNCE